MSVLESLPIMLFMMLMVFAVLAVLFILIRLFALVFGRIETRKNAAAQSEYSKMEVKVTPLTIIESEPTPDENAIYGGELVLYNVDEPTAAMIMAIVSDGSDIPLSELCFRSIKKKA